MANAPNIVYILADDMGYGDVSCLNPDGKIHTAHIDRMASEGVVFADAHAGSSVCTPTRYGVLTGRYCWRSRLKEGVLFGFDAPLIDPSRLTVPGLLRQHGYRTGCFGKWHLGLGLPTTDGLSAGPANVDWSGEIQGGPCALGFDEFYGISASLDMPPYTFMEGDGFVAPCTTEKEWIRKGPAAEGFEAMDVLPAITRRTVEFIEAQPGDQPFFAYLPLNAPHTPILPTESFQGASGINDYADFCLQVDDTVGQVLAALERSGRAEETLIIFTSDNGCSPMADFETLAAHGHHPSYIYRGHKADIFEGGHRIPFVARWPGMIPAGTQRGDLTCLTDLIATCADVLGAELPAQAGEDSVSILLALLGKDAPPREGVVHHSINGSFSIRHGRWKLEMCPGSGGWSAPQDDAARAKGLPERQLYDVSVDPGETRNLVVELPEIVADLTALLDRYVETGRSSPGPAQSNDGARHWKQLWWM